MTVLAGGCPPPAGVTATNRPSSTCRSVAAPGSAPASRAPRTTRSITGLLQPLPCDTLFLAARSVRGCCAEDRLRPSCLGVGIMLAAGIHPPHPGVHYHAPTRPT